MTQREDVRAPRALRCRKKKTTTLALARFLVIIRDGDPHQGPRPSSLTAQNLNSWGVLLASSVATNWNQGDLTVRAPPSDATKSYAVAAVSLTYRSSCGEERTRRMSAGRAQEGAAKRVLARKKGGWEGGSKAEGPRHSGRRPPLCGSHAESPAPVAAPPPEPIGRLGRRPTFQPRDLAPPARQATQ